MINITPEKVTKPYVEDNEVILSVRGVSKKFCRDLKRSLFYGVQDVAGELAGFSHQSDKLRKKEFWALDNVSFELKRGEALGLVGKNGSGKSTLLRIIAGLIKPDLGTVKVKGRVAPSALSAITAFADCMEMDGHCCFNQVSKFMVGILEARTFFARQFYFSLENITQCDIEKLLL